MCRRIIVAIILFASTGCSVLRRAENAMELLATANQRLAEANQRMAETNQRLDMVQAKLDETSRKIDDTNEARPIGGSTSRTGTSDRPITCWARPTARST
jgi:peptidoglycan hydrolase CwlO-like protein